MENKRLQLINNPIVQKGSKNAYSKLKEKDVLKIKSLRYKMPARSIAKIFNVSKSCITMIQTGRNWKHI